MITWRATSFSNKLFFSGKTVMFAFTSRTPVTNYTQGNFAIENWYVDLSLLKLIYVFLVPLLQHSLFFTFMQQVVIYRHTLIST